MNPVLEVLIIWAVAFFAATLGSMSGGGSSMIVLPVWLMLGFPLPVAIASNCVGGAVWTLVAARNYLRGQEIDWALMTGMAACGLLGALGGTQVILHGNPASLQRVIGVIILALVAFAYFRKDFGVHEHAPTMNRLLTSLSAVPLGFYEVFFGSGNGIFTAAILTHARGFKLLRALGYYYCMSFLWCILGAATYIAAGKLNLTLVVPASIGGLCGAYVGSHIGVKKGAAFVKSFFIAIGAILGLKLLLAL